MSQNSKITKFFIIAIILLHCDSGGSYRKSPSFDPQQYKFRSTYAACALVSLRWSHHVRTLPRILHVHIRSSILKMVSSSFVPIIPSKLIPQAFHTEQPDWHQFRKFSLLTFSFNVPSLLLYVFKIFATNRSILNEGKRTARKWSPLCCLLRHHTFFIHTAFKLQEDWIKIFSLIPTH